MHNILMTTLLNQNMVLEFELADVFILRFNRVLITSKAKGRFAGLS